MSHINTELNCCGINEICNIRADIKPEYTIKIVCKKMFGDIYNDDPYYENGESNINGAFFIFSDIKEAKHGKTLARYIKDKKLGTVLKSPTRKNPNTNNKLTMWIWTINHRNLKKHWDKTQ